MFLMNRRVARVPAEEVRSEAARLEGAWREAARLVSARWALFLEARAEGRQWAFASYVAALDAEEAAAEAVAYLYAPDGRQAISRGWRDAA